jgi:hypothetical protein
MRAMATAWLAPLPPGFIMNSFPITVSPGTGSLLALMTISVFELPITTILFFNVFIL